MKKLFKNLALVIVLVASAATVSAAEEKAENVKGGDTDRTVNFSPDIIPYKLTITTAQGWTFKTASMSSSSSWSGFGGVSGLTSISTSLGQLGPENFTVTVSGDLNPPKGPGTGPVNYEVNGCIDGNLAVEEVEAIIGTSQTATFISKMNDMPVKATWTVKNLSDGSSPSYTTSGANIIVGPCGPGKYEVKAEANQQGEIANLKVIALEISGKDIIEMGGSLDFNLTVEPSGEDLSEVFWTCAKGGTFTPEQGAATTWTPEPGYASNGTADVRIRANYNENIKGEKYVAVVKVQSLTAESEYGTASNGATLNVMPNTSVTFRALSSHGNGSTWPQGYPEWTLDGDAVSSPGSSTYTYTFTEGNHQVNVKCGTSERRVNIRVAAGITMVYQVLGDTYWFSSSPYEYDYKSIAQYGIIYFAANLNDCNGQAMTVQNFNFIWGGEASGRTGSVLGVTFSRDPSVTGFEYVSVSAGDFSTKQYFYVVPLQQCTIRTMKTSNPPDSQDRLLEDTEIQAVGETYEFTLHPPILYSIANLQNMLKLKYEVWDATQIDTYGAQPLATGYGRTIVHTWTSARSVKIRFYFDNGCDGQSVTWGDEQTISLSDPRKTSPAFNVQ